MSRRRAAPPIVEPGPIMTISASCYCGASSVPLLVRASHAEERVALALARSLCPKCGNGNVLPSEYVEAPAVATLPVCPTCGRPL